MPSFTDIYGSTPPSFSFEFFPPKKVESIGKTKEVMQRISQLSPGLMTVTYGAGGGTRELTRELTSYIAKELGIPSVAHLTCVGHTVSEIDTVLNHLYSSGVSNILALRGDPPKGADRFTPTEGGFSCARDLVDHISKDGRFYIAVAGYPEIHPEAESREIELKYLKEKVDAGAEVIITQLFFSSDLYFDFVDHIRSIGVTVPVIPGIMPISNVSQLERFTSMCGATIPEDIRADLLTLSGDKEAIKEYGTRRAVQLCNELLAGGAPGIHFYTLNKSKQVEAVCQQLNQSLS